MSFLSPIVILFSDTRRAQGEKAGEKVTIHFLFFLLPLFPIFFSKFLSGLGMEVTEV